MSGSSTKPSKPQREPVSNRSNKKCNQPVSPIFQILIEDPDEIELIATNHRLNL
jgi:hypothetical protein